MHRGGDGSCVGNDRVGLQPDQLLRERTHALNIAGSPAIINPQISAIRPAQLLQAMDKGRGKGLSLGIAFAVCHQHTDAPYAVALCARTVKGHAAAAPLTSLMNSRRLIASLEAQDKASSRVKLAHFKRPQPMFALGH